MSRACTKPAESWDILQFKRTYTVSPSRLVADTRNSDQEAKQGLTFVAYVSNSESKSGRLVAFPRSCCMPSIFSRSKNSSNTFSLQRIRTPDEFGRVHVAPGGRTATTLQPPYKVSTSKRPHSASGPNSGISSADAHVLFDQGIPLPTLPDGSFLPLLIPPKRQSTLHEYGYIGSENDVFLGLDETTRLVAVVTQELSTRGTLVAYALMCLPRITDCSIVLVPRRRDHPVPFFHPGAGRLLYSCALPSPILPRYLPAFIIIIIPGVKQQRKPATANCRCQMAGRSQVR